MLSHHITLGVLWILYCVLHSVLAGMGVKQQVQRWAGAGYRYYRLFYTLFSAIALAALLYYQFAFFSPKLYQPNVPITVFAALVSIAGLMTMIVCIKKYFLSLSGLKSLFQESPASELMITGIHRYVRHPLYSGTFLTIWGVWMLFPTWSLLIANVVITLYTLFAIRLEEEKLVTEFGDPYREYQRKVPKLIPRF